MLSDGTLVIDADSHWTEPPDLFTRMAPEKYKDRVPHVEDVDGEPMWVLDGKPMGRFSSGGGIGRDGRKEEAHISLHELWFEKIHVGAWDPTVRLEVMDECGIDAQIIFPSTIGLGGQDLGTSDDP
ncbi:MAG: amidohydrolase, partial [Acidimicrobiia bacterium]